MNRINNRFFTVILCALVLVLTQCHQEGPAEKAGKKVDQSIEKAGEKIEKVGEAISDKVEGAPTSK
jgi:hyperosmotically inducible protein